jgi:hypothetical protein
VNGDNKGTSLDALIVINHMARGGIGERQLADNGKFSSEQLIGIELGRTTGTRIFRMEVVADFGTSSNQSILTDWFSVYLVDPRNSTETLIDRGVKGTSLFALSPRHTETAPGLSRWDGRILEIDLSSITDVEFGQLRIQLINGDSTTNSNVVVRPLSNFIDTERQPSQRSAVGNDPTLPSTEMDLTRLNEVTEIDATSENVRFDSSTGQLVLSLGFTNRGAAIGRELAVVFPGLPAGVVLQNASGVDHEGAPYINIHDAIPSGGLGTNDVSRMVEIRVSNPNRSLVNLLPRFFSGASNLAPVLNEIADQSVVPGNKWSGVLIAVDPDNDPVKYSLIGAESLPHGELNTTTGQFEFSPSPDDLGTYRVKVQASDGILATTREFTLTVAADPLATTRVSGRVLDVDQTPLSGVRVEVGAVQGLTAADGSFLLDLGTVPLATNTLKVRGETFVDPLNPNKTYPFIAEKLPLLLDHQVFVGFNNLIERPIYLPKLDVANGKSINPIQDTEVTTAAIPGASLLVKAGSLVNQQGTAFAGTLSITEVPPDLTPAALPNGLIPDLVVTIQPGEMVFTAPSPLTLPNRTGFSQVR